MTLVARADRWLIEKVTEPVTHFAERGFGLTNWMIARFCAVMVPVADATILWQGEWTAWRHWFYLLMGFFFCFARFLVVGLMERMTGANWEKRSGFMIALRLLQVFLTSMMVLIVVLDLALDDEKLSQSLLGLIGSASLTLHLYFCACDKPPPLEEKSWAWKKQPA